MSRKPPTETTMENDWHINRLMETVHHKCHAILLLQWAGVHCSTQWQVEAIFWYTCICTHIFSFRLSLEGNQILDGVCICVYLFYSFIATFKGHGHTSEIFLGFYFSLTLVKHSLCVCLTEIFIVAFPCLWSPSCSAGVFHFLLVYLF